MPPRLQALVTNAERLLAAQTQQQYVSLEHELVQLRIMVTDVSQAPAVLTQRVERIECVVEGCTRTWQRHGRTWLLYCRGWKSNVSRHLTRHCGEREKRWRVSSAADLQ